MEEQQVPSPMARAINCWIRLVVLENNPLNICESKIFRDVLKHDSPLKHESVSRRTLRKYLIMLADIVSLRLKSVIGKGNCIADSWSCKSTHYVALYHQWPTRSNAGEIQIKRALLAIEPLLDESDLGALSIADFIVQSYAFYSSGAVYSVEDLDLVVCLTLDNCSTNHALAVAVHKPMIGAHCHRLNLAALSWTKQAYDGKLQKALDSIHAVMKRASSIKNLAKMHEYTHHQPVISNKTRWKEYSNMAIQYSKMHNAFVSSHIFDNVDPNDGEEIDTGHNVLPVLLRGTIKHQFQQNYLPALIELKRWLSIEHADLTMLTSKMFKSIRESPKLSGQSLEFEARLRPDHSLVKFPEFENGVVKIMAGRSEFLTDSEQEACECLWKTEWPLLYRAEDATPANEDCNSPSKYQKLLTAQEKHPSYHESSFRSKYVACEWISPTTVIVESLFSKCSRVMVADRRKMHARLLKAVVFLKENTEWWDVKLVQEMVSGLWNTRLDGVYSYDGVDDELFDEGDW